MAKEIDRSLNEDIIKGNLGVIIERLADANLSPIETQILLATAIRSRARVKELEADAVDASVRGIEDITGNGSFERRRAENLRKLARKIEKL
ncbi:MAG: hypothetical protein NTZ07_01990 [Candidatus Woesebacteria bacterium]|nr:hypothetical protein [Candidatus Woesebacteria bacterium]